MQLTNKKGGVENVSANPHSRGIKQNLVFNGTSESRVNYVVDYIKVSKNIIEIWQQCSHMCYRVLL